MSLTDFRDVIAENQGVFPMKNTKMKKALGNQGLVILEVS
jgi:hypothetical protein